MVVHMAPADMQHMQQKGPAALQQRPRIPLPVIGYEEAMQHITAATGKHLPCLVSAYLQPGHPLKLYTPASAHPCASLLSTQEVSCSCCASR